LAAKACRSSGVLLVQVSITPCQDCTDNRVLAMVKEASMGMLLSCPIWQLRSMWLLALDGHGIAVPVG